MKENFSSRQYIVLIIMFGLGLFVIYPGNRPAQQDAWIVNFTGSLIFVPQILMIGYINNKNQGKNIFMIFKEYFGKTIGTIFSLYFIISILLLAAFTTRIFAEYMKLTTLHFTPLILVSSLIVFCCAYVSSKNMQSIARLTSFLFLVFFGMFLVILVSTFSQIHDFQNVFPMFHLTKLETLKFSYDTYMHPYYEFFVLLFFGGFLATGKSHYKPLFLGVFGLGVIISINAFRNILILGSPAVHDLYFPSNISNSLLNNGSLIEKFELLYSFVFTICAFAKLALYFKAAKVGLKNIVLDVKDISIIIFISIAVILFSTYFFTNLSHSIRIFSSPFKHYMNFGLLFIIILTFGFTIFKNKKEKPQKSFSS